MNSTFGQIRPLVSMVTDRVMMGKTVSPLFWAVFHPFLSILAGNNDMYEKTSLNFGLIGPQTAELAALERLKKSP